MGGPNLGLVDIKLYVIDEYLWPPGDYTCNYEYDKLQTNITQELNSHPQIHYDPRIRNNPGVPQFINK